MNLYEFNQLPKLVDFSGEDDIRLMDNDLELSVISVLKMIDAEIFQLDDFDFTELEKKVITTLLGVGYIVRNGTDAKCIIDECIYNLGSTGASVARKFGLPREMGDILKGVCLVPRVREYLNTL